MGKQAVKVDNGIVLLPANDSKMVGFWKEKRKRASREVAQTRNTETEPKLYTEF